MGDFNVDLLEDSVDKVEQQLTIMGDFNVEQQQLPWWEILVLPC